MYGFSNCSSFGLTKKRSNQPGNHVAKQERGAEHHQRRGDEEADRAQPHIGPRDNRCNSGKANEQPERRQLDMNVGIAGADDNAVVVVEQKISV